MQVTLWPIENVIPYARNARKIPDSAIDKVAASIQEFGFRQPIVVDSDGVIIAGHTRLLAAQKLGLKEVPVHVAEGLTKAQIKAYRLMDNRSHQDSSWEDDLLSIEISELNDAEFDLQLTGFEEQELDQYVNRIAPEGQEDHWKDMPEFQQDDLSPWQTLKVHFREPKDRAEFSHLIGQSVTESTLSVWHPRAEIEHKREKRYVSSGAERS